MLSLEDFENMQSELDITTQQDVKSILKKMKEENMELIGWEVIEIPENRVYCLYNQKKNEAFDYELDEAGKLTPHYYKIKENTTVTKFLTKTIRESIKEYSF
ncbi:hypothetical protein JZO78_04360 [Enterococcus ureilyticus]|uniref:hypothetical protein n=1 Tax=Enterococcus ureilyticus TaxID=1131292 RepID=UPI001A912969|nr:hypothetical protein [Enterococcus ureilyticus]MBO0445568.1 hypothetical protein [Enterococcus ureilyticus]